MDSQRERKKYFIKSNSNFNFLKNDLWMHIDEKLKKTNKLFA
jgi:hypothetical protein